MRRRLLPLGLVAIFCACSKAGEPPSPSPRTPGACPGKKCATPVPAVATPQGDDSRVAGTERKLVVVIPALGPEFGDGLNATLEARDSQGALLPLGRHGVSASAETRIVLDGISFVDKNMSLEISVTSPDGEIAWSESGTGQESACRAAPVGSDAEVRPQLCRLPQSLLKASKACNAARGKTDAESRFWQALTTRFSHDALSCREALASAEQGDVRLLSRAENLSLEPIRLLPSVRALTLHRFENEAHSGISLDMSPLSSHKELETLSLVGVLTADFSKIEPSFAFSAVTDLMLPESTDALPLGARFPHVVSATAFELTHENLKSLLGLESLRAIFAHAKGALRADDLSFSSVLRFAYLENESITLKDFNLGSLPRHLTLSLLKSDASKDECFARGETCESPALARLQGLWSVGDRLSGNQLIAVQGEIDLAPDGTARPFPREVVIYKVTLNGNVMTWTPIADSCGEERLNARRPWTTSVDMANAPFEFRYGNAVSDNQALNAFWRATQRSRHLLLADDVSKNIIPGCSRNGVFQETPELTKYFR